MKKWRISLEYTIEAPVEPQPQLDQLVFRGLFGCGLGCHTTRDAHLTVLPEDGAPPFQSAAARATKPPTLAPLKMVDDRKTCPRCNGSGTEISEATGALNYDVEKNCIQCGGDGKI